MMFFSQVKIIIVEAGTDSTYLSVVKIHRFSIALVLLISTLFPQFVNVSIDMDIRRLKENDRRVTAELSSQLKTLFESTLWDEQYGDLEIPLIIHLIFEGVSEKGGERVYSAQCLFSNGSDQRYFAKLIQFPYSPSQGVLYSPVIFQPLASAMEYYACLILAGEADTYDLLGGTKFYERARELAIRGLSSQYPGGWSDRSNLVDMLSKNRGLRLARFYFYEADALIEEGNFKSAEDAFDKMLGSFGLVFNAFPRERYSILFLDAHAKDFSRIPLQIRNRRTILDSLAKMDPDNKEIYQKAVNAAPR